MTSREKLLDQEQRLLAMREHLKLRVRPSDPSFDAAVVDACVRQVEPIIAANATQLGETIIERIGRSLGVRFEEVQSSADIEHLKKKYLVGQRELGFAMLDEELADPNVDALLFQRMNAPKGDHDQWVAVLNMQATHARAYWSRPHELLHRLAEPPQQRLKFYRHRSDDNRVERIMDLGAAELAFPRVVFGPIVEASRGEGLDWDLVRRAGKRFAPTASLLSTAKAFLRHWPNPAFLFTAQVRGRRSDKREAIALRISIEGFSASTERSGVRFFDNMRPPPRSPLTIAFNSGEEASGFENLASWTTSRGAALPNRRAFTSAVRMGSVAYALISLV